LSRKAPVCPVLGDVFRATALEEQLSEKEVQRAPFQLAARAPLIIAVIARYQEHEKVPWVRAGGFAVVCA